MKGLEVAKIIELADAIIIDNNLLIYPTINENKGLYSMDIYTESEGLEYNYSFRFFEDDNIEIKDNKFILLEGDFKDPITIQILIIANIHE